ncbi:hypothetical protein VP01_2445g2 [Puccinia sorghi]|uniref:Uncharacterized protein n=1 Tax=Puccinia sorghi TaxID=27349 RepID=A0A0L6V816_9BASI|nr:hypothetical protein VP01_2445g2 [Puccinia sorghi]
MGVWTQSSVHFNACTPALHKVSPVMVYVKPLSSWLRLFGLFTGLYSSCVVVVAGKPFCHFGCSRLSTLFGLSVRSQLVVMALDRSFWASRCLTFVSTGVTALTTCLIRVIGDFQQVSLNFDLAPKYYPTDTHQQKSLGLGALESNQQIKTNPTCHWLRKISFSIHMWLGVRSQGLLLNLNPGPLVHQENLMIFICIFLFSCTSLYLLIFLYSLFYLLFYLVSSLSIFLLKFLVFINFFPNFNFIVMLLYLLLLKCGSSKWSTLMAHSPGPLGPSSTASRAATRGAGWPLGSSLFGQTYTPTLQCCRVYKLHIWSIRCFLSLTYASSLPHAGHHLHLLRLCQTDAPLTPLVKGSSNIIGELIMGQGWPAYILILWPFLGSSSLPQPHVFGLVNLAWLCCAALARLGWVLLVGFTSYGLCQAPQLMATPVWTIHRSVFLLRGRSIAYSGVAVDPNNIPWLHVSRLQVSLSAILVALFGLSVRSQLVVMALDRSFWASRCLTFVSTGVTALTTCLIRVIGDFQQVSLNFDIYVGDNSFVIIFVSWLQNIIQLTHINRNHWVLALLKATNRSKPIPPVIGSGKFPSQSTCGWGPSREFDDFYLYLFIFLYIFVSFDFFVFTLLSIGLYFSHFFFIFSLFSLSLFSLSFILSLLYPFSY